ncbi:hypothetical protein ACRSLK_09045 [Halopseudomonas pachastrellae]|uniref:hypothetical protein n=1 Tax=Halopseudomonas pachastrellae TaxID=254161 RepID=UPI003D7C36BC|tara:strand:+ start:101 stop:1072 length:972 start_codon:yes stop_codon:yes gene_type:complete
MEALFIVAGLVGFLVAWLWLVASSLRMGSRAVLLAVLLPLVTPFLRETDFPRLPRLLILLSLLCLGGGLFLLQQQQPERFQRLLSGQWQDAAPQGELQGTLMGQPFAPDRVYWRGDQLVFAETVGERTRRSLVVRFDRAQTLLQGTAIDLIPGDDGPWPEMVIQWYTGALSAPGLRRIAAGYSLSLSLSPQGNGSADMVVHLHLPAEHRTWLGGRVRLNERPAWLGRTRQSNQIPPPAPEPLPVPVTPQGWQEVSLLAVLDEPEHFVGQRLRLVTIAGREYEGVLKAVTTERRLVLSLPQGANQVDFQFQPLDIALIETQPRR